MGYNIFRQVLFLGAREDAGLESLRRVATTSQEALRGVGHLGGGRGGAFAPHVTIAKLSKVPWRRGQQRLRQIPRGAWASCAGISAGAVTLSAVQLCRMGVRKV